MRPLSEYSVEELRAALVGWGSKPSHAERILRAHYAQDPARPVAALRLPADLAARLAPVVAAQPPAVARHIGADGTRKLLLRLADGRTVETVLMADFRPERAAGCVSSQVGCAMGCDFCATTKTGFERNLSAGEMVEQFLALRREALEAGRRLQTLVFMGMGEPMLNLDAVIAAIQRIAGNACGGLGWRQVTVSTVGVVPGIEALAASGLNVHLAVSLHGPDDATRRELIPAGRRYGLAEVMAAADRYQAVTGRPVTIQYCLLKGVNDSPFQAGQLADLVGARRMHVNLLHYNATGPSLRGRIFESSTAEAEDEFLRLLRSRGIVAHFRRSRGDDIEAACGQLRRRAG